MSDGTHATRVRRIGRGALFWVSLAWLVVLVGAAAAANWIAPHPNALNTSIAGRGPSWRHPFGMSRIGHDMLARSIHASRLVLVLTVVATLVGLVLGGGLGLVAGYAKGWTERIVLTVLDAWIALPSLMVLMAVVTYVGRSVWLIALFVGLLTVPMFARITRSATRTVAGSEYVLAARMAGARYHRVMWREVVPNIALPVLAYTCIVMGLALLMEGTLSFLGVGLDTRRVTWGALVLEGQRELDVRPYLSLIPSGLFFATILALNVVGDRLAASYAGLVTVSVRRVRPAASDPSVVPPRSDDVLVLDDVRTTIDTTDGPVHAVRGVSLTLPRGRTLALVGESGSGKTLLARSILGVLPATASSTGRVWFGGRDLRTIDEAGMRAVRGREIAMVFQDPMSALDPVMRVGEQIAELARLHLGLGRREAKARARSLMAQVGIGDVNRRARQYPHELSGGLRQRVAIAMALAGEPEVLIADEPTSALDVTVQAQILDLLRSLQRDRGLTVLLVTHDLGIVASHADEVAVMYGGRVVERAPTRALFAAPAMPYTVALLRAVPRLDAPSHQRAQAIGGQPPDPRSLPLGCAFAPRCDRADEQCGTERPVLRGTLAHEVACVHPIAQV